MALFGKSGMALAAMLAPQVGQDIAEDSFDFIRSQRDAEDRLKRLAVLQKLQEFDYNKVKLDATKQEIDQKKADAIRKQKLTDFIGGLVGQTGASIINQAPNVSAQNIIPTAPDPAQSLLDPSAWSSNPLSMPPMGEPPPAMPQAAPSPAQPMPQAPAGNDFSRYMSEAAKEIMPVMVGYDPEEIYKEIFNRAEGLRTAEAARLNAEAQNERTLKNQENSQLDANARKLWDILFKPEETLDSERSEIVYSNLIGSITPEELVKFMGNNDPKVVDAMFEMFPGAKETIDKIASLAGKTKPQANVGVVTSEPAQEQVQEQPTAIIGQKNPPPPRVLLRPQPGEKQAEPLPYAANGFVFIDQGNGGPRVRPADPYAAFNANGSLGGEMGRFKIGRGRTEVANEKDLKDAAEKEQEKIETEGKALRAALNTGLTPGVPLNQKLSALAPYSGKKIPKAVLEAAGTTAKGVDDLKKALTEKSFGSNFASAIKLETELSELQNAKGAGGAAPSGGKNFSSKGGEAPDYTKRIAAIKGELAALYTKTPGLEDRVRRKLKKAVETKGGSGTKPKKKVIGNVD